MTIKKIEITQMIFKLEKNSIESKKIKIRYLNLQLLNDETKKT
jgi:hypothetical protein